MIAVARRDMIDARGHLATAVLCAALLLRRPRRSGTPTLRPAEETTVGAVLRQLVQVYRALPVEQHSGTRDRLPALLLSSPRLTNESRSVLAAAGAPDALLADVERCLAELEAARQPLALYLCDRLLNELLLRVGAATAILSDAGHREEAAVLQAASGALVDLGLTAQASSRRPWPHPALRRRRGEHAW